MMASRVALLRNFGRCLRIYCRRYSGRPAGTTSGTCEGQRKKSQGLVLGIYGQKTEGEAFNPGQLTASTEKFNDMTKGKLLDTLSVSGAPNLGQVRVLYNLDPEFSTIAVAGLGKECEGWDEAECIDCGKENIRIGVGSACRTLQNLNVKTIWVESCGHAESAAEGAALALWAYQDFKADGKRLTKPTVNLYDDCDWKGWQIGLQKAEAQNMARLLSEMPANVLTPSTFAHTAVEVLCQSGVNVEVKVRGWIETQKMGAVLAVSKGSCEPPVFLELSYYGTSYDERPILLVGAGITFDSGGLCLKRPKELLHMRGAVSGAACIVGAIRAIALMRLPLNLRALLPLCENMPGCAAFKPGDIVRAMNGKSVRVETTAGQGRLLLADALYYAQNFWPKFIVDVAALTPDLRHDTCNAASAVYTNSDPLWDRLRIAGAHTGDRVWRLPLWRCFSRQVTDSLTVEVKSLGRGVSSGSSNAAAILREFVPCGEWVHFDTYGVMRTDGREFAYLREGMSGRPTRTIVEFLAQLACVNK